MRSDELRRMRARLVPNPVARMVNFGSSTSGVTALGGVVWPVSNAASTNAPIWQDPDSGCIGVVDARLDEPRALATSLGVSSSVVQRPSPARLIVQAYLQWGEQCAERVRGDFAFAIWDPRQQRLFCARDVMGVRPLYLHYEPGKLFAFASRAQALLALPDVPTDLNDGRIADALIPELEGIDKTCTFFDAITRLSPAHCVAVRATRMQQRRYWQLQLGMTPLPGNDMQWAEALTAALERAVKHHVGGDATDVGAMLSGGMDSSSLALMAADQRARAGLGALSTFSAVDDNPACEETRAVHAMLEHPGFAPTLLDPAAIDTMRPDLLEATWQSGEPFDWFMTLLHAQYHAAARNGVHALVDGIDGDTLFSSSNGMIRQLRALHWLAFWRNYRGFARIYPEVNAGRYLLALCRSAFVPDALRLRVRGFRATDAQDEVMASSLINRDFAQHVNLRERLQRLAAWRADTVPRTAAAQARQAIDHPHTASGLERYHRVAAWHGVEPRHPFFDRDVLELCVNLPDAQRFACGWSKIVLRRAMCRRLPATVCWRKDKNHLGWGLIKRLLLSDDDAVVGHIKDLGPVLSPYVDAAKLRLAVREWTCSRRDDAGATVLEALALGAWLTRHRHIS